MDFLGDDFWNYFRIQLSLVRQWIHVRRQSTRLWGVSHIFYVNVNSDPEVTSWLSLSTETGIHSANCAADRGDLTGTVLGLVVDAPVVVQRQVPWFRQYRIPWRFRSCSLVNRWPMSLLCWFAVAVHRQGLHCLMGDFAAFCGIFRTPSVWT